MTAPGGSTPAPSFVVDVPEADVQDLRSRLRRTRFADDFGNDDWSYGFRTGYLRELVTYWAEEYDWRHHERAMNSFDNRLVVIDDVPLHFLWERSGVPGAVPLVVMHGWPWTSWDLRKVIRPLAHPDDGSPAFDVLALSLPGYGFSSPLRVPINFHQTADLIVRLMDRLGYGRFGVAGGDWGSSIAEQLGHKHADRLVGVFTHFPVSLTYFLAERADEIAEVPYVGGVPDPAAFAPDEAGWQERNEAFMAEGTGYGAIQVSRPQTLAAGLNDSPAGLLAWIGEKRRSWADTGGDMESVWSKDELCTAASIYWFTGTIGTAARFYAEAARVPWTPSHDRRPVVEAPTGATVFVPDVMRMPRAWTERYFNLKQYRVHERGGHFAPFEVPEVYLKDLRDFFALLATTE